jgi:hypothetical protein|tara:strand:- start:1709 stop:1984 length:276 start_codon:yes stop_codon:yes gene_type:complete
MDNFSKFINNSVNEAKTTSLPPKLHRLLRMGLANQEELETVRRALRQGDKAMSNPLLRKKLIELLNKFIEAIEDDNEIFRRIRNRVQKGIS